MRELCLVHLARAQNGLAPFQRFLESYRENPAGIDHDLLVVLKGFARPSDADAHRALLAPLAHATLEVSDEGFDITAYYAAVGHASGRYRAFCFLNSYSEILVPGWLEKLHRNLVAPGVGLVGATGSWNSHSTNARGWILHKLGLGPPPPTAPATGARAPFRWKTPREYARLAADEVERFRWAIHFVRKYDPFPNYHVRTNAFLIDGPLLESVDHHPMRTKIDAYRFESGRSGLTSAVLRAGRRALVVGRDGRGYEKEEWDASRTFWISEQENLLVADNQTRDYQAGTPERRSYLRSITWGDGPGSNEPG